MFPNLFHEGLWHGSSAAKQAQLLALEAADGFRSKRGRQRCQLSLRLNQTSEWGWGPRLAVRLMPGAVKDTLDGALEGSWRTLT